MTLDEARNSIGAGVVYAPGYGPREDGVIVGVSSIYVFVRYQGNETPKATAPGMLTFLANGNRRREARS